jgi:hypothetical protein
MIDILYMYGWGFGLFEPFFMKSRCYVVVFYDIALKY